MQKIDVVLVLLNVNDFKSALKSLNFDAANLVAIVSEGGDGLAIKLGSKQIPFVSFSLMQKLLDRGADYVWLINGWVNDVGDIWKMKKFLLASGVPEDNIVNFEILPHIGPHWLGNLKYIEEHGADFFATGISYTEVGLDLDYIPHKRGRGVNLACSNQDLLQGYQTAKYVFEHVEPGTIKYVLIGLTPYSFRYENAKSFAVCSRNLQYMLALNLPPQNLHDMLLKLLTGENIRNIFRNVSSANADLNFDKLKEETHRTIPATAIVNWESELGNVTKKFFPDTVEKNLRVLEDYIRLCLENGAKPIGMVFPFAPIIQDNYDAELLKNFREIIGEFEEAYDFVCVDMFTPRLGYDYFYNMSHLNLRGAREASAMVSLQLFKKDLFDPKDFCDMSYSYLNALSNMLIKDDYNALMDYVFKMTVRRLSRKPKLKVGFVLFDAAMWCGDELYNYFAADERFEPMILMGLRCDVEGEIVREEFRRGVEQFKARGLNVVALTEKNSPVPAQDVLIFLTPYLYVLPDALRAENLTASTLLTYVPYDFGISTYNLSNHTLLRVAWKNFFQSPINLQMYEKISNVGMPRGIFSGYPKMDVFFSGKAFTFDWKMTTPDAKKIIWAPHWSINNGVNYATFQWNYRFMYEFAKAHPEISWVVKPHPNLPFATVDTGLFASIEAYRAYLQAWNELPNAKVVTGGYYQAIFATSDGMIHDSGSFIAEYQYTHKPMIFLTRETQRFNELGQGVMNVTYRVDGRDLQAIADMMEMVFIQGHDPLKSERLKFFNEHMNYVKHNGMTASEFIYRSIAESF
ncbi:MAG: CDP-glycerol glycerophosphotransferase family protein [Quinella sp. 2Q5]|nr:CDP-glycerol glycerophosphotransferase family protein [Quinella sp. 2Q5]